MKKIIFNNEKQTNKLLESGFSTDKANYDDLILIADYYINELGYTKDRTELFLNDFCTKWDSEFNYVIDRNLINNSVKNAIGKRVSLLKDSIDITVQELDIISTVKNFKKQKVLFVILCLAKAYHKTSKNYTINRDYDVKMIQFSKVNMTINNFNNI